MNSTETFSNFLTSVDRDLGRDADSLHLFEWVVEDRYYNKLVENQTYFNERPDLLDIHNEQVLFELNEMLYYFESIEEYEKCSRLKSIIEDFKSHIK